MSRLTSAGRRRRGPKSRASFERQEQQSRTFSLRRFSVWVAWARFSQAANLLFIPTSSPLNSNVLPSRGPVASVPS